MSNGCLEEIAFLFKFELRHQKTKSNIFWFTRKEIIEIFNITKKYTMKSNTSVVSCDAILYQSITLIIIILSTIPKFEKLSN